MKALALMSGGLDSMLAAKTVMNQGITVEGIHFKIGFSPLPHKNQHKMGARWVAEQLGIPLHEVDVIDEFKNVVFYPKHGYGANLNPCLDCKIFMVKKALQWANKNHFDFLITGEVIGQRPKSQLSRTLPIVVNDSGAEERLLRPLCAKLLPMTYPEKMGWVDRSALHDINGRSRKPQIALAKQFGFDTFPQPAGGCLLTESRYSDRLRDLWQSRGEKDYDRIDLTLLKLGRQLRLSEQCKLIITRNQAERELLTHYSHRYIQLDATNYPGPLTIIDGNPTEQEIHLAAQITARYSDGKNQEKIDISIVKPQGETDIINVIPLAESDVRKEWVI